jgi:hypothetical protein
LTTENSIPTVVRAPPPCLSYGKRAGCWQGGGGLNPHMQMRIHMEANTFLMCPGCLSRDGESWDEHVCSWCGQFMVEAFRLPEEDQVKAWTQLTLIKS